MWDLSSRSHWDLIHRINHAVRGMAKRQELNSFPAGGTTLEDAAGLKEGWVNTSPVHPGQHICVSEVYNWLGGVSLQLTAETSCSPQILAISPIPSQHAAF